MNDEQLLRYSRHILLDDIDIQGQQKLLDAHVLIVGIGGLGSPAALYLSSSGIGKLTLVDDDQVELSNLQRQIIHSTETIGRSKPDSAKQRLHAINPTGQVVAINARLAGEALANAVSHADIVLDCTDNLETRFALNQACHQYQKPLVSGAAIRWEGQISVFDHRDKSSACYRCLYNPESGENLTCSESGVVAPLVGIIGTMQALEAVKLIVNTGSSLTNRLLLLDGKHLQWHEIALKKDPNCPCCADKT